MFLGRSGKSQSWFEVKKISFRIWFVGSLSKTSEGLKILGQIGHRTLWNNSYPFDKLKTSPVNIES